MLISVVQMKIGTIVFTLIASVTALHKFTCGPDDRCLCDSVTEMDCSDTHISIQKTCEFINNVTDCNISSLHLERNSYQNVHNSDFKGCEKLYKLYLGRNNISCIEKNSFVDLNFIELLDLSGNNWDLYDKRVLQNLTFPFNIKTLILNGNSNLNKSDQRSYPDLSYLTNIKVLYMDGLKDKIFPVSYRKMQKLKTLVLSGLNGNCKILQITNMTFANLPYIRNLNVSACHLENIYAGAFQRLSYLETLDLSHNFRLGFRTLRNISYSLQFTNIKSLNYSKVCSTFGLGTLVTKRGFCYFWNTTLTEMVFNSNRIQLIETNAFILLPETLKILRVEDNKFTFGPYYLQWGCMSNLEEFYGNYQNGVHNPFLFQKEPIENHNDIINDTLDCPFMQNDFLRNISIVNKNCHFFENDNIDLHKTKPIIPKKCKRVELAACNINFPVPSLIVLPSPEPVEYLDFSGNILHSWIGPVGPIPNLKYLNLARNYCTHVGLKFFEFFQSVENLQHQENFLGPVLPNGKYGPVIFHKLVNVKVLNLSSNIISYLPPTVFSTMSKLETLDLSFNVIETIDIDMTTLNSLLNLNLSFNFLRSLPVILRNKLEYNAKRLGKMFTIDLRNNIFSTNCDEKEFLRWMVKHRNSMLHFKDYISQDKAGKTLSVEQFIQGIQNLEKECRSYTLFIVFSSIGISVFLAIVIGGFIYRNRWKLRYLMRLTKIKHFGYKKLHDDLNEPDHFMYDAFVSYANEDLRFILDRIIPKLEEIEMKLCIHDRDFLPGNNIADNILEAIRKSRKTVVILSKEFLKSKWCLYEFNMARMESIYSREGDNCLLVVMFENVPTVNMSTEMLQWIHSNTYIEYTTEEEGNLLFWENLKDALNE